MSGAGRPVLRFAPSPNGRLHLGHAYSALLNAQLAERLGGRLLLRIEDIDPLRSRPELVAGIVEDLAWLGLAFEEPVRRQSEHIFAYRAALAGLAGRGLAYPCFCSRRDVAEAAALAAGPGGEIPCDPDGGPLYPGRCRAIPEHEARERAAREPHAWRLDARAALAAAPGPHGYEAFVPETGERRRVAADPARWGDVVIGRRDVPTSYHLSVVLDDALQGVSHVVRGRDLEAATDLHVLLRAIVGLPGPAYHHHVLIVGDDGGKLAKSKGSQSLRDLRAQGVSPEEIRAGLGFS